MHAYSQLSNQELVDLLKSNDKAAFTEIYRRFQGLLFVFAFKLVKDDDNAADLVQEVFIYLWDKRDSLDLQGGLSAYLYSAVRYKFFNQLDHRKVQENYQASFDRFMAQRIFITDDHIRERELSRLVEREIANLPKKMREVFELSRKTPLSQKEIAEVLQISDKTVKKQIHNAVKILKIKFGTLFSLLSLTFVEITSLETLVKFILKKY